VKRLKTGIYVFADVEVLDFCGPFEVFSVTRLDGTNRREEPSPFDIVLVAETADTVRTTGGMKVVSDHSFETCPQLDLLVVPGGWGTRRDVENQRVVDWVRAQAAGAELVVSVCTGSFLLAKAGLLAGKRATTHWMSLDRLRTTHPEVTVEDRLHWVDEGKVMTAAGISAGIDLALKVVARVCGEPVARATAKYMEYPFPESDARRI
jgi:transcriptional regulator GlxA family with amidase domain